MKRPVRGTSYGSFHEGQSGGLVNLSAVDTRSRPAHSRPGRRGWGDGHISLAGRGGSTGFSQSPTFCCGGPFAYAILPPGAGQERLMRHDWAPLALITQLGLTMVGSILLGLVLGLWIVAHF